MDKESQFGMCIQDRDGIIISKSGVLTTFKIARGAYVYIPCTSYPKISFESYINEAENAAKPLTENSTLLSDFGPVKYSGSKRLTITLSAVIPIKNNVPTQAQYFGSTSTLDNTQLVTADIYLLFNMWRFNHRYYLRDTLPGVSKPDFGLPINILMNRTDMIGSTIFNSSGVPVVIKKISPSGNLKIHKGDDGDEILEEYTIELVVTNYGT